MVTQLAETQIHEELRLFRLERGLTYRQLAGLLGLSISATHGALNGKRTNEMTRHKLQKFLAGVRKGGAK